MNTRSITKYGLIDLELLLAAAFLLPGRAMAPLPPFRPHQTPRQINLVQITERVRLPGGRRLEEARYNCTRFALVAHDLSKRQ